MNLTVSTLFFEVALILIPGIVWMRIHTKYGAKGETTQFDMILNAFLFGVISYVALYFLYAQIGITLSILTIDPDSKQPFQPKLFIDILRATGIAIVLSIIHLFGERWKLFTRFVQTIGATRSYGDEDVWDFVFNSSSKDAPWVNVRDFEHQAVYSGFAQVFSESGQLRELLLIEVKVYDFEGQFMYEVPRMYLARPREGIHIEFPPVEEGKPNDDAEQS